MPEESLNIHQQILIASNKNTSTLTNTVYRAVFCSQYVKTYLLFSSSFAIFTLLLALRSGCEIYDQYRHHNDNTVGQLTMLGRSNASFVAVFRSQVMVLI